MEIAKRVIKYLKNYNLKLVTAESCSAGQVTALLGKQEGCGDCLEVGYIVYSQKAKKSILGLRQSTIDKHSLTSEEVALEMVSQ